jgi:hypothetical protein
MVWKFGKYHLSRLLHPLYSPGISPCDSWFFGVLEGILKNHRFHSSDEIEGAVPKVLDDLTFEDVQRVFHNWMNCSAWAIMNDGEYTLEYIKIFSLCFVTIGGGAGTLPAPRMRVWNMPKLNTASKDYHPQFVFL